MRCVERELAVEIAAAEFLTESARTGFDQINSSFQDVMAMDVAQRIRFFILVVHQKGETGIASSKHAGLRKLQARDSAERIA